MFRTRINVLCQSSLVCPYLDHDISIFQHILGGSLPYVVSYWVARVGPAVCVCVCGGGGAVPDGDSSKPIAGSLSPSQGVPRPHHPKPPRHVGNNADDIARCVTYCHVF